MTIISRKARYALHGLAYIAVSSEKGPVSLNRVLGYLRDYSQQLALSPTYIAKIFQEVSRAGFVEAISGPRGGYRLARPAASIRIADLLEALDGPFRSGCCMLSVGECPRQSTCGVRRFIREAEEAFYRHFERETVASLARKMTFPDEATIESRLTRPRRRAKASSARGKPRRRTSRTGR